MSTTATLAPTKRIIKGQIDDSIIDILKKIIDQKGKSGLSNAEKKQFSEMIMNLVRTEHQLGYTFEQTAGRRRRGTTTKTTSKSKAKGKKSARKSRR